ncbi:urea ABC transporter permease subunit UrtB [Pseudothioclava arenosa]|uniref:Urea ABC transporter permease subunit UrtB n=1 Tax=Pseudothioclava arenosa TaxID=1795308 RepID=A0A2A4CS83_9RHOB|nr:urea ABC transporter permease subunit UrtB [Pseudothioclava arenosa]PCD77102.1 urea ABC transporter permease subunit UrtB [Pseudothioclava arenosa]
MRHRFLALTAALCLALPAFAQETPPSAEVSSSEIFAPEAAGEAPALTGLAAVLATYSGDIAKPSRKTIGPVIAEIGAAGEGAPAFLAAWADKRVGQAKDGRFYLIEKTKDGYALTDPVTGAAAGTVPKSELSELKPNAGVRGVIASALVEFQLSDPDPAQRRAALDALARNGAAEHLEPLRASIETEADPAIREQKERLERLLTVRFGTSSEERVAAIEHFNGDLALDVRGALNPIVVITRKVFEGAAEGNVAQVLRVGKDLGEEEAYLLLVEAGLAPARLTASERRAVLEANIDAGAVAGVPIAELDDPAKRNAAYKALVAEGKARAALTEREIGAALAGFTFADVYSETDATVTAAAALALQAIDTKVGVMQAADLGLDALSLASIYFLAAIGLAITFGVMGVINMAHGEFITMGAYTGYVVQLYIADYTTSILVALPLAFLITAGAGVAMERLVIRHLYKRPLETLLATFGISIALQQIFKNIFGTQARPLTSPAWLDGAWMINDVVSISYIRIAIFVLALIFLALFLWVMKRTRLGLEVRAVTQNPSMAASMGINPDRINMLTFGLGSGIAGIAGVAIGLFAKVTSELGSDYIVQSFMTVVVGGVGNIWGTLAGATLIGFLQKTIEWFNPSNTLAAQTYMILFIIAFIQFRPRGIIALKGRAAGD